MGNGLPVTPEMQTMMNELVALIGSGKIDDWGTGFLKSVVTPDRRFLTPGQINTIEKMHAKAVAGKKRDEANVIVRTPWLKACKQASGWQIYIDQKAVGISMTRIDAERILIYFEHSWESIVNAVQNQLKQKQNGEQE